MFPSAPFLNNKKIIWKCLKKWKSSNKELSRFALIILLNFNFSLSCNSKRLSKQTLPIFPTRINYYPGYSLSTFHPLSTRIQFNGSWEQWDTEHYARLTKTTKHLTPGKSTPSNRLKRIKMETDNTSLLCLSLYSIHNWRDCYEDIKKDKLSLPEKLLKCSKRRHI